jgi:ornithine carbamoyltransferase
MSSRRFLNLSDVGGEDIAAILGEAMARKEARAGWPKGKVDEDARWPAMCWRWFREAFDAHAGQLRHGHAPAWGEHDRSRCGLVPAWARRADCRHCAGAVRYVDAIMIRTDDHAKAEALADHATVPVINGLTDLSHPCQILADMQTVIERRFKLAGSKWAWSAMAIMCAIR